MDFNFDFDILGDFDPEQNNWDALIEAVVAGNVVPVIGPDIICEYEDHKNINDIIISTIEKQLELSEKHQTFSQLVYDPEFTYKLNKKYKSESRPRNLTKDAIYSLIKQMIDKNQLKAENLKPSHALTRLLNTNLFPFVITTSFVPVVESAMKEAWRNRNVKVLSFSNNIDKDRKVGIGDISSDEDMTKPTIYYMFGKTDNLPHSYVLTDNDMLEFCRSWLSETNRPKNLSAELKDKYLLMLGCGYSDWLFRFIWFCMNKTSDAKTKGLMARDKTTHESLVEYLRRVDTFLPDNKTPEEIIREIERRVKIYNDENSNLKFERPPKIKTDVFISYSRRDSEVADRLYHYLSDNGLIVWFDKNNLLGGEKFMDEIFSAIDNTSIFIPILTDNIEREAMQAHPYREEWERAMKIQRASGNKRTFIIPINKKGFNINDADIPADLKSHNSLSFDDSYDFSDVLRSVNEALNKLDNFKSTDIES